MPVVVGVMNGRMKDSVNMRYVIDFEPSQVRKRSEGLRQSVSSLPSLLAKVKIGASRGFISSHYCPTPNDDTGRNPHLRRIYPSCPNQRNVSRLRLGGSILSSPVSALLYPLSAPRVTTDRCFGLSNYPEASGQTSPVVLAGQEKVFFPPEEGSVRGGRMA